MESGLHEQSSSLLTVSGDYHILWLALTHYAVHDQASRPYTSLQTVAGGYKEAGKGFPTAGFIDIEESPITKNSKLYVRKCYPDLYNIIKGGISKVVNIAITGTPGIGKSCFLLYFILQLLYESTDDEPNIVIFHPEPNVCYCYYGTELAYTGSYNDFTNFLDIPNVWCLSDIEDGPPERVLAKSIVALSPERAPMRFPDFTNSSRMSIEVANFACRYGLLKRYRIVEKGSSPTCPKM